MAAVGVEPGTIDVDRHYSEPVYPLKSGDTRLRPLDGAIPTGGSGRPGLLLCFLDLVWQPRFRKV